MTQPKDHPGTGVVMTGVVHPADGTLSPPIAGSVTATPTTPGATMTDRPTAPDPADVAEFRRQPLAVEDCILHCAGCSESVTDSGIDHAADCPWLAGIRAEAAAAERHQLYAEFGIRVHLQSPGEDGGVTLCGCRPYGMAGQAKVVTTDRALVTCTKCRRSCDLIGGA
jgi:hypothetical protein